MPSENTGIVIVYDNTTKQCAEFLLGLISELVKKGEGKINAVLEHEKTFAKQPSKNKSANQKIIYIGNFPESKMLSKNIMKWQFDKFGFRYGWLGYKSVITFDDKKITEVVFGEMVEYAKSEFEKYPIDILNEVEEGGFWNSLTTKEKVGVGVGGAVAAALMALLVASDSDTECY